MQRARSINSTNPRKCFSSRFWRMFTPIFTERAAKAVLAVCRRLSDTGDMVFIENDAKLLLQRLPEDVKNVHYHDDETHIRLLLEKYDLVPSCGISLAAATVRGLILTVSHKEQIGELYPQVLETLVYGACRELFK